MTLYEDIKRALEEAIIDSIEELKKVRLEGSV